MTEPRQAGAADEVAPAPQVTELTFRIPPAWWMTSNSNRRDHYRTIATRVKNIRALALSEAIRNNLIHGRDRVHIAAYVTYPDKRVRDTMNTAPVQKALVDGLVDYGLVPDDNDKHLLGPHAWPDGITKGVYTVRFVITDQSVPTDG